MEKIRKEYETLYKQYKKRYAPINPTKKNLQKLANLQWPEKEKEELRKRHPNIIERKDWGARPPKTDEYLNIPVDNVILTDSGSEECTTHDQCVKLMVKLQKRDMDERGLPDIQHNYYVGSRGNMYEGRGCLTNSSRDPQFAHLDGKSMDIAYIGDFKKKKPSIKAIRAGDHILKYFIDFDMISEEFNLYELGATEPENVNFKEEVFEKTA